MVAMCMFPEKTEATSYRYGCRCSRCMEYKRLAKKLYELGQSTKLQGPKLSEVRQYKFAKVYNWTPASDVCQLEECDLPARVAYCCREHGERARNRRRKRRSRPGFKAPYTWDETIALLRERDGDECQICHGELGPVEYSWRRWSGAYNPLSCHLDHIHPVVAGGDDELDNLQITHARCNLKKNDELPEEGLQPVYGPTRADMPKRRRTRRKGKQWTALHGPFLREEGLHGPCKFYDKTPLTGYSYGCRCHRCKGANNSYQREYFKTYNRPVA